MPQIFGWEHLTYVAIVTVVMISLFYWMQSFDEAKNQRMIKITAVLLLLAIIWNRVSITQKNGITALLPDSYCGTSSLCLALITLTLRKDHPALHSVAYVGLIGGFLTLIYPDFIGQHHSIFYPMTISGLLHHTISVFLVMIMLKTGYLKPKLKKWYLLPIGLSFYLSYGIFLITIVGLNDAFYIYQPVLENTPFNWFVLGIILLPTHVVILYLWERVEKLRLNR